MHRTFRAAAGLASCLWGMLAGAQAPNYHVAKKVVIGGEGGFDYVTADPTGKRVFMSHGSKAVVYDLEKDAVAGEIPNTIGIHGVALAPDVGRGFTSNGRDSSVTIFDYKTLAVITKLQIPAINPDAIMYDEATKRVFTFNHGTHDATVIDAAKGTVVGSVPNLSVPETGVADGKGNAWVNIEDKNEIVHFDTRSLKEIGRVSIAPCEGPSGLAMDRANGILFAVCNKVMAVVDAKKDAMITTVPICSGPDAAAFDPGKKLAFASCGDGTISVVQESSPTDFKVVQTVQTQRGARTMSLDPMTHRLYTVAVEYGPAPEPTTPGGRPGRQPTLHNTFSLILIDP